MYSPCPTKSHPILCIQVAAIGYLNYVVGWGSCQVHLYIVISYISLIKQPCLYACIYGIHIGISEQSARIRTPTIPAMDQTLIFFCFLVLHCGRSCGVRLLPSAHDLTASALCPLRSYGYRILVFNYCCTHLQCMHEARSPIKR